MNGHTVNDVKILDNNDPRIYGSQACFSRNEFGAKTSTNDAAKTERINVKD